MQIAKHATCCSYCAGIRHLEKLIRHRTQELQDCREELVRVRTELRREVFSRPTRRGRRTRAHSATAGPGVAGDGVADVEGDDACAGVGDSTDRRGGDRNGAESATSSVSSQSDATFEVGAPVEGGQLSLRKRSRSVPFTGRVVCLCENPMVCCALCVCICLFVFVTLFFPY